MINLNKKVSFKMDCQHKLVPGEKGCNYSMKYESVIGKGDVSLVTDLPKKNLALKHLMKKYEKNKEFEFTEAQMERIYVFKIVVSSLTGKSSLK